MSVQYKLAKFGGTSTASHEIISHLQQILAKDPDIRYVVLSAPGKRNSTDTKITDRLIALASLRGRDLTDLGVKSTIETIAAHYAEIYPNKDGQVADALRQRFLSNGTTEQYVASLKAFGEEWQARLFAEKVDGVFVDPLEYLCLSGDINNARVEPETFARMAKLDKTALLVIPGFYGRSREGHTATFSRGGSDKTGAIFARGLEVSCYDNFTDSPVLAADPHIVPEPKVIAEMTRLEMRALSYGGSEILHPEALLPLEGTAIPIHVRSTSKFPEKGTYITKERISCTEQPVIGIAYRADLVGYSISSLGTNDNPGLIRRCLQAVQKMDGRDRSLHFLFTGIDDMSFLFPKSEFNGGRSNEVSEVLGALRTEVLSTSEGAAHYDPVKFVDHIGCIVVAGKGVDQLTLAQSLTTLHRKNIKVIGSNFGFESHCLVLAVDNQYGSKAVNALYQKFFA